MLLSNDQCITVFGLLLILCLIYQLFAFLNISRKKRRLYNFIKSVYFSVFQRHSYITKILELTEETELTKEIKAVNENILRGFEGNEMLSSQRSKAEAVLGAKMKELIDSLEQKELSEELKEVVTNYKDLSDKFSNDKKIYNDIMQEFMKTLNINLVKFYAEFKKSEQDKQEDVQAEVKEESEASAE